MYSTCIYCTKPFGRNEALDAFSVGERLAFDAKRGRLWVVCRTCERWNLSPLDERWEAVEQAERAYRETRTRVATDNIGLAKLRDGTTLVRIGQPLRPEFAAWRYGDQFGRRRKKALVVAGAVVGAFSGVVIGGVALGVSVSSFVGFTSVVWQRTLLGNPETVIARIRSDAHGVLQVRRKHLNESHFGLDEHGELSLRLRAADGAAEFTGREAARVASLLVPAVNRFGGNRANVATAVKEIEDSGSPDSYIRSIAELAPTMAGGWVIGRGPDWRARLRNPAKYGDGALPATRLLALEMALHEDAERRALEGELAELELAWRDAEEIAGIADGLTVPPAVAEGLEAMKARTSAKVNS